MDFDSKIVDFDPNKVTRIVQGLILFFPNINVGDLGYIIIHLSPREADEVAYSLG